MDPFEAAEVTYRGELFAAPSLLSLVSGALLTATLFVGAFL